MDEPSGRRGRTLLQLPSAPAPVRAGAERLFGSLAGLRESTEGLVYRATLSIDGRGRDLPDAALLRQGARHRALVRFSRSAGLPQPLTDVPAMSIRIPDAYGEGLHQDFMLISSGGRPVLRHMFLPARSFFGASFSSLLPYSIGGSLSLVGALPITAPVRSADETDVADLAATAAAGALRFRFAIAAPWGRWRPIGELTVGTRLAARRAVALGFTPWNTGGGIVPVSPFVRGSAAGGQAA